MSDLNIALILRLVDRATGPARRVVQNLERSSDAMGRRGLAALALADDMATAQRTRIQGLALEAAGVVGVGYALSRFLRPAIEFEAAMDRVKAVSGATEEELSQLTGVARQLGRDTRFTAIQAAEGMQFLAMAGFDVNEAMTAMPGLLNLAAAGAIDLGSASDIASNILTGFQLTADDMDRVGDVLTSTFTSANVDLQMLGNTMSYVAPVAADMGVSLEQVAAMAGKLGDAGIQGERAGTALRAMLASLAAPSSEAADMLEELGIQAEDADGNLRPVADILSDMDASMASLGSAERTEALATIFGREAMSAASVLIIQAGSGALQEYAGSLTDVGSAARVAHEINDNISGSLARMQSAATDVAITIGTQLLPPLADLVEALIPIINNVSAWAEANPELLMTIAQVAAGLLAMKAASIALRFAFEPLATLVITGTRLFGWLNVAFAAGSRAALTLTRALIWLSGMGLGALALAAQLLRGALGMVVRGLRTLAVVARAHPVLALISAVAMGAYAIYDNWDAVVGYMTDKFDRIKAAFDVGFLQGMRSLWAELNPFTLMRDAAEGFFTYVTGWSFDDVTAAIVTAFDIDLFQMGVDMLMSLKNGIWSILTTMVAELKSALSSIVPQWMQDGFAWVQGGGPEQVDLGELGYQFGTTSEGVTVPTLVPDAGRALGGPVRAGGLYRVNERGEEFFQPDVSGLIINARDSRAILERSALVSGEAEGIDDIIRPGEAPFQPARSGASNALRESRSSAPRSAPATQNDWGGIHIYPPAGADPRAIARLVGEELDRRSDRSADLHDGGFHA